MIRTAIICQKEWFRVRSEFNPARSSDVGKVDESKMEEGKWDAGEVRWRRIVSYRYGTCDGVRGPKGVRVKFMVKSIISTPATGERHPISSNFDLSRVRM
jgi:hypothetical protein